MLAGKKILSVQTYPSIETKNSSNIYKQMYIVSVEQK